MTERLARMVHVDRVLEEDGELHTAMADATIQLLESARYDTTGYMAWATAHASSVAADGGDREDGGSQASH